MSAGADVTRINDVARFLHDLQARLLLLEGTQDEVRSVLSLADQNHTILVLLIDSPARHHLGFVVRQTQQPRSQQAPTAWGGWGRCQGLSISQHQCFLPGMRPLQPHGDGGGRQHRVLRPPNGASEQPLTSQDVDTQTSGSFTQHASGRQQLFGLQSVSAVKCFPGSTEASNSTEFMVLPAPLCAPQIGACRFSANFTRVSLPEPMAPFPQGSHSGSQQPTWCLPQANTDSSLMITTSTRLVKLPLAGTRASITSCTCTTRGSFLEI